MKIPPLPADLALVGTAIDNYMSFFAILTIAERELIRYWRDKGRILSSTIQSLMFLFVFGSGFSKILSTGNFGVNYLQFVFPGIIAMNVMGTSFFSTISTVWDREFGFLKEILVAPVSRVSVAVGKTLGAVAIATIQATIMLILAPFIGLKIDPMAFIYLIIIMLLLAFATASLGLLLASLVKTMENFGLVLNLLVFPMFFLSGAFFPLNSAPPWMTLLSEINPVTYGVDSFRSILLHNELTAVSSVYILHPIYVNVLFLGIFAAVMITCAVYAFNKRGAL
jgi:ABC-2 type transport system permease protein